MKAFRIIFSVLTLILIVSAGLGSIGNKGVAAGQSLTFSVPATDPDGDPLTYSASNLPSGAIFNSATKTFTWTPTPRQAGSYVIHFEVSDGNGGIDSAAVTVTVTSPSSVLRVVSLNMSLVTSPNDPRVRGRAAVTVADAGGKPVKSVTVRGHWTGATKDTESRSTNSGGAVTFTSDYIRRPSSGTVFIFVIDSLIKSEWTWDTSNSVRSSSISVP